MKSDRDALHSALCSTLTNVLVDLATDDTWDVRPASLPHQSSPSLTQARLDSFARGGAFHSTPSSQQPSLLSPSRTVPSFASPMRSPYPTLPTPASSFLGSSTLDDILLAAAASSERSKRLAQAKAFLIQQQNTKEHKRLVLLQHKSDFLNRLQEGSRLQSQALLSQRTLLPKPAAAPARVLGNEALQALGTNLRNKSDPYIDVSSVADVPNPQQDTTLQPRPRGGVTEPFPEKLFRMLSNVEKDGISHVVSFYSHGRAFGVHDMDQFVSQVMPKYFKQTKWHSFSRQLNLYGFLRITSGPDAGGYYHELFLKGRPNLCRFMRRVGVPHGEQDRRKFRPKNKKNADPDFYSMKRIG